ncbi:G protein-coupled glucose receptor regulating Gpa2-domain-containing protein [Xylariaceae sp. FL0016]|nr:G protein-coupled glucose receptor regulating Gpa2-domain-containing protein [Xylariaceae sp. FL0016]
MAPIRDLADAFAVQSPSVHTPLATRFSSVSNDSQNSQLVALMFISVSLASISVLAALSAFYWFVRMRRSFRQDLIMLLIQSDMMKALWLAIFPIVYFIRGTIDDDGKSDIFCQVSGFLLTAMIEASDIAVLLIAIHTALFILKQRRPGGTSGLHPYRHIAYTIWAVLPLILASIVPATHGHFVDNGPHCYLPTSPAWYRTAISWVPRYIIFGVIIFTYTGLYLYVYFRYRRFGRDQRSVSGSRNQILDRRRHGLLSQRQDIPPTPPIFDHGLLSSARTSLVKDSTGRYRQESVASTVSTLQLSEGTSIPTPIEPARRSSITWNRVDFSQDGPSSWDQGHTRVDAMPLSPTTQSLDADNTLLCVPKPVHRNSMSSSSALLTHRFLQWRQPVAQGAHSLAKSIQTLITDFGRGRSWQPSTTTDTGSIYLPPAETIEFVHRSRERMQRQLRLLFVYPAIYMLTWVAPFAAHVIQYDNRDGSYGRPEPFSLQVISLASLCIGAAVDCCFFSAWEKPWQHLRGGFWEGLLMRLRIRSPAERRAGGRTQEERDVDARRAQARRMQENMDSLTDAAEARARPSPRQREWWDVLNLDDDEMSL